MITENHVSVIISFALRQALRVQILVYIFVTIEFAAEIYLSKISQESLRIHWCPGSIIKIAQLLESWEKRGKCFSLDFSQLRMHFSSVWRIFPQLAVIFKDNLVFRFYNKRNKTMYAQAKKPYAHPSENSRVWDKNQHFT